MLVLKEINFFKGGFGREKRDGLISEREAIEMNRLS